jgi:hypothetical protein
MYFLLAFPPISYVHYSSPHSCCMPCPSHPPWLYLSNYIWQRVQVMKFLIMQLSSISSHFISLRSIYSPRHPVRKCKAWSLGRYITAMNGSFRLSCSLAQKRIGCFKCFALEISGTTAMWLSRPTTYKFTFTDYGEVFPCLMWGSYRGAMKSKVIWVVTPLVRYKSTMFRKSSSLQIHRLHTAR